LGQRLSFTLAHEKLKTLTANEIEELLGVRATNDHPLDILGFGFTTEGVERFRAEHPDFFPQVKAHIRQQLAVCGHFPEGIDAEDSDHRTFIRKMSSGYLMSSEEEIALYRYEPVVTEFDSEDQAISAYVERVASSDYLSPKPKG
jgi:hypothetical protein